jgi:hypothetical protein
VTTGSDAPRNWKVGDVIADLYEVTGVLGEGAFGAGIWTWR